MPQKRIQGQQIEETTLDLTGVDGTGLTNVDADTLGGQPVGITANNIVALDALSRLPAVDGSLLNNLPASGIADAPSNGTYYGRLNATWQPVLAADGGTLTGQLSINVLGGSALNLRSTVNNSAHSLNFNNIAGTTKVAFTYNNNGDTFTISKDASLAFVANNINILDGSNNTIVPVADDNIVNKKYVDANDRLGINNQTGTTYTLVLADENALVNMNNAAANTLTIPTNAAVAFPIGTQILVSQVGVGVTTIAGAGVTLHSAGGLLSTSSQYSTLSLIKKATDTWLIAGDLA